MSTRRRPYSQVERRFVPEWINRTFPKRTDYLENLPVGAPPTELVNRFPGIAIEHFRRWRFYIDAVVVLPNELILVEGKVRKPLEGFGQLIFYKEILHETPELKPYINRPVRSVLVTARPDPRVAEVMAKYGVTTEVYRPPWVLADLERYGLR